MFLLHVIFIRTSSGMVDLRTAVQLIIAGLLLWMLETTTVVVLRLETACYKVLKLIINIIINSSLSTIASPTHSPMDGCFTVDPSLTNQKCC